jgi:alkylresorcinol/alkylpyrone synthase
MHSDIMNSPRLRALATAVPRHVLHQKDVEALGRKIFSGRADAFERMRPVYANAGIETRYSCVDLEWYLQEHSWRERNELYIENARVLMRRAVEECLERAGLTPDDIDGIATVSTTGIATPSLDALLIEDMALRRNISRLPLFGLGCAGGVIGLNRVAELARARPGSKWLLVVVELCGLTFRSADMSKSNIVATALFGDGVAAVIVDSDGDSGPAIICGGEHTWPNSLDIMGWQIRDNGFGVLFSRDIPDLVRTALGEALDGFLRSAALRLDEIDEFIPHPGGMKVLAALSQALSLPADALRHAHSVLRDYGNMSAASVFFVLERALAERRTGRALLSTLGPGFTAGFSILEHPS